MTVSEILGRKKKDEIAQDKVLRIVVVITAYDYPTAAIADRALVDVILVGDSGGMVMLGYHDTRKVSMEEMLFMSSAASRGTKHALLVADMPFMSYQVSVEEAVRNAGRLIKEGGADAVKLEGGREIAHTIKAIATAGIPVMGHIGFTPQTTPTLEGYRVQGKTADGAIALVEDARALEEAGVFSIVMEMTTSEAAKLITESVSVPTIGIGSGGSCDGQVLVLHDLLGLSDGFHPKFAKKYLDLSPEIQKAIEQYANDVKQASFPEPKHQFHMDESERAKLQAARTEIIRQ